MTYCVGFKVDARAYVYVEAKTPQEAREQAEKEIACSTFIELEWIDFEAINAEDECGNITDI